MQTHELDPAKVDEMNDFQKFLTTLSTNLNKALNGEGELKAGYVLFLFDAKNPAGTYATMLHNVPTDAADYVVRNYVVKKKMEKRKKERRK